MHTHDIQGRPWSPCEACPHPTPGSCPSRRHRAYCELAKTRPELVAGEPAEERPARDVPKPLAPAPGAVSPVRKRVPEGARIKAVMACAAGLSGGGEDASEVLARETAGEVDWLAVVVDSPHDACPSMLRRFGALAPVRLGREAAREDVASADVLVGWGVRLDQYVGGLDPRPSTVYVSHSPVESAWALQIIRESAHAVDAMAAVSESALGVLPPGRSGTVIPNVPNLARLAPEVDQAAFRASLGVRDGERLIGYVGRLSPEKRTVWLARVLGDLPGRYKALWVGSGPQLASVADEVQSLGLGPRALLLPARPDVGTVYHALDCYVGMSEYESYGLTLAEAMACGCPVVSTNVGIVKDHPAHRLARVAGADPKALAEAVLADEADEAGRRARVERAKAWARAQADPASFREAWVGLIESLTRPEPAPAKATFDPALAEDVRRAKACPHRGCRAGCQKTRCEKYQKDVYLSDCRECISEGKDR